MYKCFVSLPKIWVFYINNLDYLLTYYSIELNNDIQNLILTR